MGQTLALSDSTISSRCMNDSEREAHSSSVAMTGGKTLQVDLGLPDKYISLHVFPWGACASASYFPFPSIPTPNPVISLHHIIFYNPKPQTSRNGSFCACGFLSNPNEALHESFHCRRVCLTWAKGPAARKSYYSRPSMSSHSTGPARGGLRSFEQRKLMLGIGNSNHCRTRIP
jgi:hypothetical protein